MGSTQNTLKERMGGHYSDVRKWFQRKEGTDSFAKHMVRHFDSIPKAGQIRDLCTFEIIRAINPFSFMRGIRTYECRLCMEEKVEILKAKKNNPRTLINENSDIYGPCRHRTKFHRYLCTDELCESEKNSRKYKKAKSRINVKRRNRKRASLGKITNTIGLRNRVRRVIDV